MEIYPHIAYTQAEIDEAIADGDLQAGDKVFNIETNATEVVSGSTSEFVVANNEGFFTASCRATLRNGRWNGPHNQRGVFYEISSNYSTSTQPNPSYALNGRVAPYDVTIKKVFLSWNYTSSTDVDFDIQFVRQTKNGGTSVSNTLVGPEAQYTITDSGSYKMGHLDTTDSGVWDDIVDVVVSKGQILAPLVRRTTSSGSSNLYLYGFTWTILYTVN